MSGIVPKCGVNESPSIFQMKYTKYTKRSLCLSKCIFFYSNKSRKRLSESMECMNAYQWVTDDVLQQISRLEHDPNDKTDGRSDAQDIIDRIYCRDLYKLIGEKRVKWEKESIKVMVNLYNVICFN